MVACVLTVKTKLNKMKSKKYLFCLIGKSKHGNNSHKIIIIEKRPQKFIHAYFLYLHCTQGRKHASIHRGRVKTPGCGQRGVGLPPLISTSFVTRRDLCRASTAAKEHL